MSVRVRSVHPSVFGANVIHWWEGSDTAHQTVAGSKLSAWTDKAGGAVASQSNDALRPAAPTLDGEVRFAGTNINMALPAMSRSYYEHRWFLLLFRVKWSTVGPTDGSLFSVGGTSGSDGTRQPYCGYAKSGSQVQVQWRNRNGFNQLSVTPPGDDVWHSLVARRVNGVVYLSLDKGAEQSTGTGIALPIPIAGQTGILGDFRTTGNFEWGLDTLLIGQGDLSTDDVARLHSYAMNRRGI